MNLERCHQSTLQVTIKILLDEMATAESQLPTTPPHHPTYNVRFSKTTLSSIVSHSLPGTRLESAEQLESGKSFNNRIYFLKVTSASGSDSTSGLYQIPAEQETVLKVSGQFFGPEKVQNEVSCLLLLEKYCPIVPAPRVLAWSEGGSTLRRVSRSESLAAVDLTFHVQENTDPGVSGPGWILMSRRPGRPLRRADLEEGHGHEIVKQLAQSMAQWRQRLPPSSHIGNFKHEPAINSLFPHEIYESFSGNVPRIHVDGLVLCHYVPPGHISTCLDYYKVKLEDQLMKLETEPVFAARRDEVSPLVRSFIQDVLPKLSLFHTSCASPFTFTHYDFSPRNILVSSEDPSQVTGILDFEFAGFFPEEEEFTNNAVANVEDWPAATSYDTLLTELGKRGVKTPLSGMDEIAWQEACALVRVIADVAPWYLREGGMQGEELERELQEAATRLLDDIAILKKRLGTTLT